ncbi:uncharacterized protein LOC141849147 [Brevipalpus obovatus]|uniref:uncharacterized protein LOC141849147 n=1 Tax=Brevipalpus obovatus TaxID=246614 RepID=UPI003D9F81FD
MLMSYSLRYGDAICSLFSVFLVAILFKIDVILANPISREKLSLDNSLSDALTSLGCNISPEILHILNHRSHNRGRDIDRVRKSFITKTSSVKTHVSQVKLMVISSKSDGELDERTIKYRKEWFPNVATMGDQVNSSSNPAEVLDRIRRHIIHYTHKWGEIVKNQSDHREEPLMNEFNTIHRYSHSLLCEINLILGYLIGHPDSRAQLTQLKEDLDQTRRDSIALPKASGKRLIYEYIVLKDYIQALDLIIRLFNTVDLQRDNTIMSKFRSQSISGKERP